MSPHGVMTQKNIIIIFTVVRTNNLAQKTCCLECCKQLEIDVVVVVVLGFDAM
jgi:hypothetical protein